MTREELIKMTGSKEAAERAMDAILASIKPAFVNACLRTAPLERQNNDDVVTAVIKKINYAAGSYSLKGMYEVFGWIKGLCDGGVLSAKDGAYYTGMICRDYINNSEWWRKCYDC